MEKLQFLPARAGLFGTLFILSFILLALHSPTRAHAGLGTLTHFIAPGEFSLGADIDLTLTSGAGVAGNLKFTQGVNELVNMTAVLGSGCGPRRFRVGGNMIIDFIPDIDGQPGMGFAIQGIYFRLPDSGQLELTGIPYLHKTFVSGNNEIEPFLGLPLGAAFSEGRYRALSQVVAGSMFKSSAKFRYTMEFGIAVNNTESYIAGGITYYP